jgi:2-oxoglutarate ferredoxin oxidoreductase subunit delta
MMLKKKDLPEVEVYKAWCKACGICAAFCPTGAIARDEAGYPHVDPAKCIRCGWCEIRCPDFAITVEQKNEEGIKAKEPFEKEGTQGTLTTGK